MADVNNLTKSDQYYINKGYKAISEKKCECCNKRILIFLKRDLERKRFCSRSCFGKINSKINNLQPPKPDEKTRKKIGKILSEKMKLGLIPKPPSPTEEVRKKIGKTLSEKMRLGIISKPSGCHTKEARKKAGLKMRGENHPRWIKDRSKLKRSRLDNSFRNEGPIASWRKSVFERDNYTCQKCYQKGNKLNAHHIKPWALFPDLRFEISNGLTLCVTCHRKEHKKCHL